MYLICYKLLISVESCIYNVMYMLAVSLNRADRRVEMFKTF